MAIERCEYHCYDRPVSGFWQHLGYFLQRLGAKIERWDQLINQRRQLREMDDHMLKDIGLSRADVDRITGHHFWDDPVQRQVQLDERYRSGGRRS